ncbi:dynein light chain roadblock-type 2 [Strongylocentrotus purpuratus]|uniref:Dynein light chain roadblock n=1 Tax=Strongylocentrotus purpuratus TaxID=7668 RepID=A0A7M7N8G6_STRPU|nr:dynein light chain roadblock-type 2 [Strongylocentrotus purpuratus]|eukprot:XP_011670307.1 PREDICTED: dynein light chain roadblock-type 2 [Strongylocentrotus purpuratus]
MAEVEDAIKKISAHNGVCGIMIMNNDGIPIRSTIDNAITIQYCALLLDLLGKARRCVRDVDPQNDLSFLRLRTKKHEIMIAPDKEYMLIVIQNPSEA